MQPTCLKFISRVVASTEGESVYLICHDGAGKIFDIECLSSHTQDRADLPITIMLERPIELGAASVTVVSRASSRAGRPMMDDVRFTDELTRVAAELGLLVKDHFVVTKDGAAISMKWASPAES